MNRSLRLLAMLVTLLVPERAFAHAHLKRSEPAAGSQLAAPPRVIRLWFSEQPDLSMTFVSLKDSAGNAFALSSAKREESGQMGIAFNVLEALPSGRYTLTWRTAASDGHPSQGKVTFVVVIGPASASALPLRGHAKGADSIAPTLSPGAPALPGNVTDLDTTDSDAASSLGNSIARGLLFVGLLALIGAVSFKVFVLGRAGAVPLELKGRMTRRAATLGIASAALVIVVSLVRLGLESQMMSAMPDMPGMKGMTVREMVTRTDWGFAFRLQVAAALAALIAFALALRRVRGAWLLAGGSALVLAITPALGGHAAASPRFTSLMIAGDWLHVLGGASWLGSLLFVMMVGVPIALRLEPPDSWSSISSLVNAFSPVALVSAAFVVASGVFASWVHVEHLSALWQTNYGRTLLVKLTLVSITLAIGTYNFKRVQPQLSNETGTLRLRRSAAAELGVGFLILLVTGLLTGISP
jgi:putative copper export protein/methionine-rich copper-binding protein CopC